MGKRKRGPISKKVKRLCYSLFSGDISEEDFKNGIQEIIDEYSYLRHLCYQDIGLAVAHWTSHMDKIKMERLWKLVDEVNPRIKEAFEHWKNTSLK